MNIADKMEMETRLMGRIADWMEKHGERAMPTLVFVSGKSCGGATPTALWMWTG